MAGNVQSSGVQSSDVQQPTDPSKSPSILEAAETSGLFLIDWDGPTDPSNPQNWPRWRKWVITLLTSFGGLVTLMSGAMLAPALSPIKEDLGISAEAASLDLSVYVLAFAFGPLFLAPFSETFGRRYIWIFGCAWYILWNTLCGFTNNQAMMVIGRLMSGIGASAEFAVSGPIVADCWSPADRGKSIAVRSAVPLLGPALGPILGGLVVEKANWRWLFWILSAVEGVAMLFFIALLPETHAQTLLSRKAKLKRIETGQPYYTTWDLTSPTIGHRLKVALKRPIHMFFTQPIIQLISLIQAYSFGIVYINLSTFSSMWTQRYHERLAISGLHYLAIVTGYSIGLVIQSASFDYVYASLTRKHQGVTDPEYRAPVMIPGVVLMPLGLLLYGWSAKKRLFWLVTDIGIGMFGCGYIVTAGAASAYITDAFLSHTASAGAASRFVSSTFAFAFPIFAPKLYSTLGYGWGNTTLACLSVVIGFPTPFLLWKYGGRLRARGGAIRD